MPKIKRKNNFTTVPNSFIRSTEISFKAKGVFTYMASFSEEWNFTLKSMATQSKDGYDRIKSAIDELKEKGYIIYEKHQDGSGTYILIDEPKLGFPCVDNPIMGKPNRIKKNNTTKKNNTYIDFLSFLKEHVSIKSKVTSSKQGKLLFTNIKDKERLMKDYIQHQLNKKEFAQRITAFMEDYTLADSNKPQEKELGGWS